MLAKKGGDLCFSCHDKFTAKFMHAPAEGGECLECHRPHVSSEPALAKKAIKTLCFDCHDQDEVKGKAPHADIGDAACTKCHDPHGSNHKFMLKATNSIPAAATPATP
jgi:predicted CXXCH cytochrome family protein